MDRSKSIADAAEMCGISVRSVRVRMRTRGVEGTRIGNRVWLTDDEIAIIAQPDRRGRHPAPTIPTEILASTTLTEDERAMLEEIVAGASLADVARARGKSRAWASDRVRDILALAGG